MLITCALSSSLLIGLVPLASALGWLSIGLLYVVTTMVGTLNMIFDVGALSYVPFLVTREHLADANSKLQASLAVAGISGPGLAGLLVGLITAPVTLSADAVSYLFSACGLLSIRRPEPEPDTSVPHGSVLSSIAEGFRAVFGTRLLWTLLTQTTVLNLFFGSYITVFVVYAVRYLHLTPLKLGIVHGRSARSAACAGALLAGRVQERARPGPVDGADHRRRVHGPAVPAGPARRQRGHGGHPRCRPAGSTASASRCSTSTPSPCGRR